MAITSVVSGQFDRFVSFAREANDENAIVKKGDVAVQADVPSGTLEEHSVEAKADGDCIGKWFRGDRRRTANNEIREIFRRSVIDIFGGEDRIPESVKAQMKSEDYDKGKPLSVRRILAVNRAIDEYAKSLSLENAFQTQNDDNPGGLKPAEKIQIHQKLSDLGIKSDSYADVNRAANFYAAIKGGSLKDALFAVLDKNSAAFIAMNRGEDCIKDKDSFARGLEKAEKLVEDVADLYEKIKKPAQFTDLKDTAAFKKSLTDVVEAQKKAIEDVKEFVDAIFTQQKAGGKADEFYNQVCSTCTEALAELDEKASEITDANYKTVDEGLEKFYECLQLQPVDSFNKAINDLAGKLHKAGDKRSAVALSAFADMKTKALDGLSGAFARALKEVKVPQILDELKKTATDRKSPLQLPNEKKLKVVLEDIFMTDPFRTLKNASVYMSDLGKNRLRTNFTKNDEKFLKDGIKGALQSSGGRSEAYVNNIIREMTDACVFAEFVMYLQNGKLEDSVFANTVDAFRQKQMLFDAMNFGLRMSTDEEKTRAKDTLRKSLTDGCVSAMKRDAGSNESLADGYLPVGIREYVKGCVTFNGREIEVGKTEVSYKEANTPDKQGFAEFLHEKFDDNHKQVRRTVSYFCSQANGVAGMINAWMSEGKDGRSICKNEPFSEMVQHGVSVLKKQRDNKTENYDISFTEDGDIKIKMRNIYKLELQGYSFDHKSSYGTRPTSVQHTFRKHAEPTIGAMEYNVELTIRNQPDSELQDGMPEFTIDVFTQKAYDGE